MRTNTALKAWREGRPTVGAWLTANSAFNAESLAHVGFDWLCIDLQHGIVDYADAVTMLQAISTTEVVPLVRVPWNDPATIMKVLDAGASGVVVPLVNNGEEAARAVAACRYPPLGIRSSGPARARMVNGADYVEAANSEVACVVMIETAEALTRLDEILGTPGVDAAYIGPADLAFAIGLPGKGDNPHPRHLETVQTIVEACQRHGVAPGIHTNSVEYTQKYLDLGCLMVTLGSDTGFMTAKASADLKTVRSALPSTIDVDV
ncbi:MAG: 2,4-dihydroxyhept-2-ene-1,7-dioic acid aldolase [Dehalococcoidia bacterium]|nr:2,4-dihydroxyhept-2-ene-1,7-dioic acid aldolase [Dehalococcoidia bacterium]